MSQFILAQDGGKSIYKFLNIPVGARTSALGGYAFSINDDDISLAAFNPSLISEGLDKSISFSVTNYYSDISLGNFAYAHHFKKYGTFLLNAGYINYGNFYESNEQGEFIGEFSPNENFIQMGWSSKLADKINGGLNFKYIGSNMYDYHSYGIAFDASASYTIKEKGFCASVIARNMGTQLKTYRDNNRESLPLEISAGLSKKLEKAPFRLMVSAVNLQKWNLRYEDPQNPRPVVDELTGDTIKYSKVGDIGDNLMRHAVFAIEFVPSKNFNVRAGYNYRRRTEMALADKPKMIGFSWGFGVRVKKISLSYARVAYNVGATMNQFTMSLNINDFIPKHESPKTSDNN